VLDLKDMEAGHRCLSPTILKPRQPPSLQKSDQEPEGPLEVHRNSEPLLTPF